jgi:CheY-like chemotaxis protein/two-component sensor histidine kinase
MSRQVQNMARMVDDLLDVSRITQGRIEIRKEPVNLTTIIERAVESARADLQAREQELVISMPDQPVILDADALRLEQVLGNLLNNASKFSSRHQRIWLTVDEPADGRVAIRVRDEGIGIAPEHLPRVFEQFMQVDSSLSRATGGLGIGLSIVRHLVGLHGGTVEAISTGLGQGSEFVVRLPASVTTSERTLRASEASGVPSSSGPRRILVADDNSDGADTLGMLLRQAGHEVRVVYGGAEALEIAATMRPEVVLVDVGMPGMDGYETARRLRQTLGTKVLLVAITGYAANRQHALAAGFNEFLVKPASPGVIARLVSRPLPGEETPTANAADN